MDCVGARLRHWVYGHEIVAEATTYKEGIAVIERLPELTPDIIILDGNLSDDARGGLDGKWLSERIRQNKPTPKIVCWSDDTYLWGDQAVCKPLPTETPNDKGQLEAAIQTLID